LLTIPHEPSVSLPTFCIKTESMSPPGLRANKMNKVRDQRFSADPA